jgi:hypothetical protein
MSFVSEQSPEPLDGYVETWDADAIAAGCLLPVAVVKKLFKDGRVASHLIEARVKELVPGAQAPSNTVRSYDGKTRSGKEWEVRCITANGFLSARQHKRGQAGR